jgi:hypothetical protein
MTEGSHTYRVRVIQQAWLGLAVAGTILWAAGPIYRWTALQTICHPDSACLPFQLNAVAVRTLTEHGVSLSEYAVYAAVFLACVWGVWYGLAALIIWRKPEDRGALLAAFFLVVFPAWGTSTWIPSGPIPSLLGAVFIAMLLIFGLLFPDGRFAPRWTRWVAIVVIVFFILTSLPFPVLSSGVANRISAVVFFSLFLCVIGSQIYRFRSHSSWQQRQQTKWAVFGYLLAIVAVPAIWVVPGVVPFPTGNGSLYLALSNVSGIAIVVSAIPITVGIAVLRNRLWDIDSVISRTLVYASLTLSLVLTYLGSVIALQALFRAITGQQSDLAIAISTLVIAALFNPLRHGIQDLIARTFYRRRYDAAQVLSAFGATCRDETDLSKLQAGLMRVVEETLQPDHVSLWLREGALKMD